MKNLKIGITERGDGGRDISWVARLDSVDAAIIISKSLTLESIKYLLKYKYKLIFHNTMTGLGGSPHEPNAPFCADEMEAVEALIEQGFPSSQIVTRIDPIFPEMESQIPYIKQILKWSSETGIKRIRYSFLDLYPHVIERYNKSNIPLPQKKFQANPLYVSKILTLLESYSKSLNLELESCAEVLSPISHHTGCISEKDMEILGIEGKLNRNSNQREHCLCKNKVELLRNMHQCRNKCLYCYWK